MIKSWLGIAWCLVNSKWVTKYRLNLLSAPNCGHSTGPWDLATRLQLAGSSGISFQNCPLLCDVLNIMYNWWDPPPLIQCFFVLLTRDSEKISFLCPCGSELWPEENDWRETEHLRVHGGKAGSLMGMWQRSVLGGVFLAHPPQCPCSPWTCYSLAFFLTPLPSAVLPFRLIFPIYKGRKATLES